MRQWYNSSFGPDEKGRWDAVRNSGDRAPLSNSGAADTCGWSYLG